MVDRVTTDSADLDPDQSLDDDARSRTPLGNELTVVNRFPSFLEPASPSLAVSGVKGTTAGGFNANGPAATKLEAEALASARAAAAAAAVVAASTGEGSGEAAAGASGRRGVGGLNPLGLLGAVSRPLFGVAAFGIGIVSHAILGQLCVLYCRRRP